MKEYEYIIFDFNGTIIDDVDLCLDILNKMLVKRGYNEVTFNKYKNIFTFPIIEYYKLAGFDFVKEDFNELAKEFILLYQSSSLNCNLYKDSVKLFEYLNSKNYKLVVLSASEINNLTQQLIHFDIKKYFKDVLGLSNIHAVSKLDVAKEYFKDQNIDPKKVLLIGDTLHDNEVGMKLGVDVILVKDGHQSKCVLEESGRKIIDNISNLIDIL